VAAKGWRHERTGAERGAGRARGGDASSGPGPGLEFWAEFMSDEATGNHSWPQYPIGGDRIDGAGEEGPGGGHVRAIQGWVRDRGGAAPG